MQEKTKSALNNHFTATLKVILRQVYRGRKGFEFQSVSGFKKNSSIYMSFCSNMSSKSLSIFNFSGKDKVQLICPTHAVTKPVLQ